MGARENTIQILLELLDEQASRGINDFRQELVGAEKAGASLVRSTIATEGALARSGTAAASSARGTADALKNLQSAGGGVVASLAAGRSAMDAQRTAADALAKSLQKVAAVPAVFRPAMPTMTSPASNAGFVYHATNEQRAREIAEMGRLRTYGPSYGTDQDAWPDNGRERRSYWSRRAESVSSFAPEEGRAVVLRTRETPQFQNESGTGDMFSRKAVKASQLQILSESGEWVALEQAMGKAVAATKAEAVALATVATEGRAAREALKGWAHPDVMPHFTQDESTLDKIRQSGLVPKKPDTSFGMKAPTGAYLWKDVQALEKYMGMAPDWADPERASQWWTGQGGPEEFTGKGGYPILGVRRSEFAGRVQPDPHEDLGPGKAFFSEQTIKPADLLLWNAAAKAWEPLIANTKAEAVALASVATEAKVAAAALFDAQKLKVVVPGDVMGGLRVGKDIPNTSSIESTFNEGEYRQVSGIRALPVTEGMKPRNMFYAADDIRRVEELAEEIKRTKRIDPIIAVADDKSSQEGAYVLEGAHRAAAMQMLGQKEIPALIIDTTTALKGEEQALAGVAAEAKVAADAVNKAASSDAVVMSVQSQTSAYKQLAAAERAAKEALTESLRRSVPQPWITARAEVNRGLRGKATTPAFEGALSESAPQVRALLAQRQAMGVLGQESGRLEARLRSLVGTQGTVAAGALEVAAAETKTAQAATAAAPPIIHALQGQSAAVRKLGDDWRVEGIKAHEAQKAARGAADAPRPLPGVILATRMPTPGDDPDKVRRLEAEREALRRNLKRVPVNAIDPEAFTSLNRQVMRARDLEQLAIPAATIARLRKETVAATVAAEKFTAVNSRQVDVARRAAMAYAEEEKRVAGLARAWGVSESQARRALTAQGLVQQHGGRGAFSGAGRSVFNQVAMFGGTPGFAAQGVIQIADEMKIAAGPALALGAAIAGLAGSVGIIKSLADQAAKLGDGAEEMVNVSQKTGLMIGQISALGIISTDMGGSLASLQVGLRSFNRNIAQSDPLLRAMGISTRDTKLALVQVADWFARTGDDAAKAEAAMQLFGQRSGTEMVPLLNQGGAAMMQQVASLQAMGSTINTTLIPAMLRMDATAEDSAHRWAATQSIIQGQLIPAYEAAGVAVNAWMRWLNISALETQRQVHGIGELAGALRMLAPVWAFATEPIGDFLDGLKKLEQFEGEVRLGWISKELVKAGRELQAAQADLDASQGKLAGARAQPRPVGVVGDDALKAFGAQALNDSLVVQDLTDNVRRLKDEAKSVAISLEPQKRPREKLTEARAELERLRASTLKPGDDGFSGMAERASQLESTIRGLNAQLGLTSKGSLQGALDWAADVKAADAATKTFTEDLEKMKASMVAGSGAATSKIGHDVLASLKTGDPKTVAADVIGLVKALGLAKTEGEAVAVASRIVSSAFDDQKQRAREAAAELKKISEAMDDLGGRAQVDAHRVTNFVRSFVWSDQPAQAIRSFVHDVGGADAALDLLRENKAAIAIEAQLRRMRDEALRATAALRKAGADVPSRIEIEIDLVTSRDAIARLDAKIQAELKKTPLQRTIEFEAPEIPELRMPSNFVPPKFRVDPELSNIKPEDVDRMTERLMRDLGGAAKVDINPLTAQPGETDEDMRARVKDTTANLRTQIAISLNEMSNAVGVAQSTATTIAGATVGGITSMFDVLAFETKDTASKISQVVKGVVREISNAIVRALILKAIAAAIGGGGGGGGIVEKTVEVVGGAGLKAPAGGPGLPKGPELESTRPVPRRALAEAFRGVRVVAERDPAISEMVRSSARRAPDERPKREVQAGPGSPSVRDTRSPAPAAGPKTVIQVTQHVNLSAIEAKTAVDSSRSAFGALRRMVEAEIERADV